MIVTFAFGTIAPLESVITPAIAPEVFVWAWAAGAEMVTATLAVNMRLKAKTALCNGKTRIELLQNQVRNESSGEDLRSV